MDIIPYDLTLFNTYPNPFNPSTTISFRLPIVNLVDLKIYDINGKLIETLYDNWADAGKYTMSWNAKGLASGVYILSMSIGNDIQTQKMIIMK